MSVCCVIDRSYPPWRAGTGMICWPRTTVSLTIFRRTDRTTGRSYVGWCLTHSLSFVIKNKCLVLERKSFSWSSLNLKPIYLIHKQAVTQPKFYGVFIPPPLILKSSLFDFCFGNCPLRDVKVQIAKENDSILMAKEFLRKQRQSLKRRHAALLAAKQELMKDVIKQKQGVGIHRTADIPAGSHSLTTVRVLLAWWSDIPILHTHWLFFCVKYIYFKATWYFFYTLYINTYKYSSIFVHVYGINGFENVHPYS